MCGVDGALREKLKKIIASDYFTATPQMKGPGEVAAGVANFGSFQVPVQVEPSAQHYTHTVIDLTIFGCFRLLLF